MQSMMAYLRPWEFSPTVLVACALPAAIYTRGLMFAKRAGETIGFWRPLAFFLGLGLIYAVLQTYFDYLSQHMFWIHRLQHLVLHHIGPFLLVLAAPSRLMARGLPRELRERMLRPLWRNTLVQALYCFLQHPVVAPLLFVGLVYFWLVPSIHFTAMLDADRYRIMNWSMAVDGILFWWLMIAPPSAQGRTAVSYLTRILILWAVMILQILLGAYISMHRSMLYDVYGICGRAWATSPLVDQELGGLLTWIPPAMMSVIAVLVVLGQLLHDKEPEPMEQSILATAPASARSAP
jgi:putative membrane protein